jgi:hypothetical protein
MPFYFMKSLFTKHFYISTFLSASAVSFAATYPIAENFDDAVADNFITMGSSGAYSPSSQSTGYAYRGSLSATAAIATGSAALPVTNAHSGSIRVSSTFKLVSLNSVGSATVGLGLFGTNADFSLGAEYRLIYLAVYGSSPGQLQLVRNGLVVATSSASIPVALGSSYQLTADITSQAGGFLIKGSLTKGSTTIGINYYDTTLLSGNYFGYRTAVNTASGTAAIAVDYDDFSIQAIDTDLVVTGSLTVLGNTDLVGNSLKIGGTGVGDEAVKIDYTEAGSSYKQSTIATRDATEFFWGENGGGTLKPKLKLGSDNTLTLFNSSGAATVTLNAANGEVSAANGFRLGDGTLLTGAESLHSTALYGNSGEAAITVENNVVTVAHFISMRSSEFEGSGSSISAVNAYYFSDSRFAYISAYGLGARVNTPTGFSQTFYHDGVIMTQRYGHTEGYLGRGPLELDVSEVTGSGVSITSAPKRLVKANDAGRIDPSYLPTIIRVAPSGDLLMGDFSAGTNPVNP